MINNIYVGLAVGAFIGWHFPQPHWSVWFANVRAFFVKVRGWFKKKPPTA